MTLSPDEIRLARSIALPGRDIIAAIIADLSEATGTPPADIRSKCRKRETAQLRQMAMCLARQAGLSQPIVAACFGVNHTTVQHAERAFRDKLAKPVFRSIRAAKNPEATQ